MKHVSLVLLALLNLYFVPVNRTTPAPISTEICIYGGNASGVIAAYTAAKMKKKVILIEQGSHLGGLTTGGLGYTDIGNKYAINGLSLDVYRRIGKHYGKFEQWIFEPSVAEDVMKQYIREAGVKVIYGYRVEKVQKNGNKISSITVQNENGTMQQVNASMFIDCSYEGDVMARAGVSYTVGREANSLYKETYNGVQLLEGHQFPDGIDPYKIPGNPSSGLVWGVSAGTLADKGAGDKKVQAYN
ncbi:MAG: FAD-dependent oxidoreductase, partial [Sphingobacteriales bacterium]